MAAVEKYKTHASTLSETDGDTVDPNTPPPAAEPEMFFGLIGEVAQLAAKDTEVNPVAAAAACISWLSAAFGRDVHLMVGNTPHHARINTLHTGRTGRGRKGDSMALVQRLRAEVAKIDPRLAGEHHGGGLSTREGMISRIHDGFKMGKEDHPAIMDKRLWVTEGEFCNVLAQARRDGNTLSAALRDAWDGQSIQPAIKSMKVWATDPHLAIHACITPAELRDAIADRDINNGFLNRFLLIHAERLKLVPFPKPAPTWRVEELARRLAKVIAFALGDYPDAKNTREMKLSESARVIWEEAYLSELTASEATDKLTALMERAAPYVFRLAMLFALTEQLLIIEPRHLLAALSWVRYARASARYVFATAEEMAAALASERHAETIVRFLQEQADGATRTQISQVCFAGHANKTALDKAISQLLADARILCHKIPRENGKNGSGTTRYRLNSQTSLVSLTDEPPPAPATPHSSLNSQEAL